MGKKTKKGNLRRSLLVAPEMCDRFSGPTAGGVFALLCQVSASRLIFHLQRYQILAIRKYQGGGENGTIFLTVKPNSNK